MPSQVLGGDDNDDAAPTVPICASASQERPARRDRHERVREKSLPVRAAWPLLTATIMRFPTHHASSAALALALASAACGGATAPVPAPQASGDGGSATSSSSQSNVDLALVGTWFFDGYIPNSVKATLDLRADGTFQLVEDLAPLTTPAGTGPTTCVTSDTYLGRYEVTTSGSEKIVAWTYTGGTVNAVSGCADASGNQPGTAATADDVAAFQAEGIIPPRRTRTS